MPKDGEMTTYMGVNITRNDKVSMFRYYAPKLPSRPCYFCKANGGLLVFSSSVCFSLQVFVLARCVCGAEIKMKIDRPNQMFTVAYASRSPEEAWPIVLHNLKKKLAARPIELQGDDVD